MSPRSYEMRRRAESYQATRDRIMEATFAMHRAKGVAATTFSDVAARAGVAPATVLRHFPTMGELVSACGTHVWEWLAIPDPKVVFPEGERGEARLGRLVDEICGIYTRGETPLAGARRDCTAVAQLAAFLQQFDAAFERLVRAGLAPLSATEHQVQLALALLDFGVWSSLRRRGLDERQELARLLRSALAADRAPAVGARTGQRGTATRSMSTAPSDAAPLL